MDKETALRYVDQWANFYLRILGDSDNLELIEKDFYTILHSETEKWDMVFEARLEHLAEDDLRKTVGEIIAITRMIWWNQYSDRVNAVIFPDGRREPTPDDDEVFAVMTSDEMPTYPDEIISVRQAETLEDFTVFHNICFDKTLSRDNYWGLYQKGMIRCYIGYKDKIPVSVTTLLICEKVYSLEFTSTLSNYRRKGFAAAVCQTAIKDAFREGAEVVTIRAGGGPSADENSKYLGKKLGFNFI